MWTVFRRIGQCYTFSEAQNKGGRHIQDADLSPLADAAILAAKGRVVWVGPEKQLKAQLKERGIKKLREYDLKKATVMPAFVECHTHTVFAGSRQEEFEMRNQGVSYQEIAQKGGGILSTMKATRAASEKTLQASAQVRAAAFARQGVTTLETKSGYALNEKDECKMLRVAGALKGPRIVSTFLGAHALPPEFSSYEDYLQFLATTVLPKVKKQKLATRVDIFVERGFFEVPAAASYLRKAQSLGFDLAVHADQLSLSGGAELAVSLGARSAEHLICIRDNEIQKLAQSQVTSVLLPASDLYMRCAYPPARALLDAGARVALATDFNPGSSPTQDLSLVGVLARLEMKMSRAEVLAAYTVNAAYALGGEADFGSLSAGRFCDFVVLDGDLQDLFYSVGQHPIAHVYREGKPLV